MFLLRGQKLDKKIPSNEKKIQDFLTSHYEKMQFEKWNIEEFEKTFKYLKQKKPAAFDDLSRNTVTDAYARLTNVLFHVLKVSIQ